MKVDEVAVAWADAGGTRISPLRDGLRMFGVRTVVLGIDLAVLTGDSLRRALGQAVIIHGTDTATAALLGFSGRVKPRIAIPLTLISLTNTALAITAYFAACRDDT